MPAASKAAKISASAFVAEVLQRFANCCMIEDPSVDKAELQRNCAFHVRAAMIDGTGHWQEAFEDRAGRRIILCLARP